MFFIDRLGRPTRVDQDNLLNGGQLSNGDIFINKESSAFLLLAPETKPLCLSRVVESPRNLFYAIYLAPGLAAYHGTPILLPWLPRNYISRKLRRASTRTGPSSFLRKEASRSANGGQLCPAAAATPPPSPIDSTLPL
ncbi:hypothetical protein PoB_001943800 [Plakobranchus ocellatus]|uniref:Uncharacterized protein n=1 Tax=Plakobranchus ocellatus TaxID=259542 RepID=A0AAV3ZEQ1_9GAST|nr:hypothetical protein PoB_001943800 [Plakobranchus ocellatus]